MRARLAFLLAGILLLVACGESFTEPDAPEPMDEATAMAVAAAVVKAANASAELSQGVLDGLAP